MLSVIHPTARVSPQPSFPRGWFEACEQWAQTCDAPADVEYIVVLHAGNVPGFWKSFSKWADVSMWGRFTVQVQNNRQWSWVDQCNAGLIAATGDRVILMADDFVAPEHWDMEVKRRLPEVSKPECLRVATGAFERDQVLLTIFFETRAMVEALGLMPTSYIGMLADDDRTALSLKCGSVVPASDLLFEHRHPVFGKAEPDEIYSRQNRDESYRIGQEAFQARKRCGFPVIPLPSVVGRQTRAPEDLKTIVFCTPGETFRMEWLAGRIELENALANAGYNVAPLLSYSSNVYKTRINLARSTVELADQMGSPQYVFWLDDDNVVLPQQFFQLMRWLDQHPDADGIAGWCWIRKGHEWMVSVGNFTSDGVTWKPLSLNELYAGETSEERSEPKPITMTGFPCFLMRYSALKLLGPEAFRPILSDACDEGFTGEDGAFCNRALGHLNLFVHPMVHVQHLKLQGLEPDFKTEKIMAGWRETVNGKAITAPKEYSVPV